MYYSGKHAHTYGKSSCLLKTQVISMEMFNNYCVWQWLQSFIPLNLGVHQFVPPGSPRNISRQLDPDPWQAFLTWGLTWFDVYLVGFEPYPWRLIKITSDGIKGVWNHQTRPKRQSTRRFGHSPWMTPLPWKCFGNLDDQLDSWRSLVYYPLVMSKFEIATQKKWLFPVEGRKWWFSIFVLVYQRVGADWLPKWTQMLQVRNI